MRLPFRHPGDVSRFRAMIHGRTLLTDEANARNVAETLRGSQLGEREGERLTV